MARGITEKDVFTACDALVLAGERPTIERVRLKIGRGSPNTVSPMLDAWFRGLGRRLQDPGALAPPSDFPEPVMLAAQHFWEVAQVTARADLEAQVVERLAPMRVQVEQARQAAALATAGRDAAISKSGETAQQLAAVTRLLGEERASQSATAARGEAAQRQIDDLAERLKAAEASASAAADRARGEVQAAHERATGAERRAAMEIENERAALGKADKRAEALEIRIEPLQATVTRQAEELVKAKLELEHERATAESVRTANEAASAMRQILEDALVEAKVAIGRAEAEARTTQAAMAQLLPLLAENKARKTAPKARQGAKAG